MDSEAVADCCWPSVGDGLLEALPDATFTGLTACDASLLVSVAGGLSTTSSPSVGGVFLAWESNFGCSIATVGVGGLSENESKRTNKPTSKSCGKNCLYRNQIKMSTVSEWYQQSGKLATLTKYGVLLEEAFHFIGVTVKWWPSCNNWLALLHVYIQLLRSVLFGLGHNTGFHWQITV